MRPMFVLVVLIFSITLKAQTVLPASFTDYRQRLSLVGNVHFNDSAYAKKWFLSKYSGISTSFSLFKGGNATVVSVPAGLQLNRRLNNNLYAFAGLSVAPAYINFNHFFLSVNTSKFSSNNTFLKSNRYGMYSRAELGLMYINNEKTFSISGSIGVEKSSYPVFPYQQINSTRQNLVISPNR